MCTSLTHVSIYLLHHAWDFRNTAVVQGSGVICHCLLPAGTQKTLVGTFASIIAQLLAVLIIILIGEFNYCLDSKIRSKPQAKSPHVERQPL